MCEKKFLFLIALACIFQTFECKSILSTSNTTQNLSECQYPSQNELDLLLAQSYINYFQQEQKLLFEAPLTTMKIDNFYKFTELEATSDINDTDCQLFGDRILTSQRSICPYRYNKSKRSNRYPFYLLKVECTCKKCDRFRTDKKCIPITQPKPFLIRGDCRNGVYEFKDGGLESIPVTCVCVENPTQYI